MGAPAEAPAIEVAILSPVRVFFLSSEYKMSSVQRFLRQIPTGTNFVGDASGLIAAAYDFIPTNGNYVGNYPPGFVTQASNTSLSAALKAAEKSTGISVVRDMGKTIYAPVSSTKSIGDLTGDAGYFREFYA